MSTSYFRFLDLPKELRLIVYEQIEMRTHRWVIHFDITKVDPAKINKSCRSCTPPPSATMTYKTLHVGSLLATCKLINDEAMSLLAPKLERLSLEPVLIIIDYVDFVVVHQMRALEKPYQVFFRQPLARCRTVAARTATPRLPEQSHQIEIVLTGDSSSVVSWMLVTAINNLWEDARDSKSGYVVLCQGPVSHMALPIGQNRLNIDYGSWLLVRELEEKEQAKLCEEWEDS